MVFGDAGLGKSRLVEELMIRAALDGASVARARAVESDRDESWMGLRALVRGGLLEFPAWPVVPRKLMPASENWRVSGSSAFPKAMESARCRSPRP